MIPKPRTLIVGATGVIGRRLVSSLADDGHDVHGLARNERGAAVVRELGGTPVTGDLLDAESVDRAVAQVRPVVVVSSDREVADGVRRHGAYPMGADSLLRRLSRS